MARNLQTSLNVLSVGNGRRSVEETVQQNVGIGGQKECWQSDKLREKSKCLAALVIEI